MMESMGSGAVLRIGVDIGGTKTDAVVVDAHRAIVEQLRLATGYGPRGVIQTAVDAVTRVAESAGISVTDVESIGIGVPGRVDSAAGRVAHAVNLGLSAMDFGGELADRLGVAVRVENDVNAAALGAYHRLEAEGWPADCDHSMAYLNAGTGLAAGIVMGGRLWRGSRGTAGEIGHIPIDPNGPLCPCGQRGCLELMASGSALARQWPNGDSQRAQHLFDAAEAGDALAVEVRQQLVDSLASAVRVLVLTVDVDLVVIGGGIATVGSPLEEGVKAVLRRRATESPFLSSLELADRVRLLPPGFPSAAVGAALMGVPADARAPSSVTFAGGNVGAV